jgi:hypothetical protein
LENKLCLFSYDKVEILAKGKQALLVFLGAKANLSKDLQFSV